MVSHLKYLVTSNQLPETINADLDKCWADINAHEKDLYDLRNLCREMNVTVKLNEEPITVMNDMKLTIDNLR